MLYLLLEVFVVTLVAFMLYSQVLAPLFKGTSIFPFFNKGLDQAHEKVQKERDNLEIARLEREAEVLRKQIQDLKGSPSDEVNT